MTTAIKLSFFIILSTTLISCGVFPVSSQKNVTPSIYPTSISPTPKPLVKSTFTPSVTPTALIITPSLTTSNEPLCIESRSTVPFDGWDCISKSYDFTVHFPSTSGIAGTTRPTNDFVHIWLENSPSDSHIERWIGISAGKTAETCFSSDAEEIQIGENDFVVKSGAEPSGVVYVWRTYAIAKGLKSVCFYFGAGYQYWNQDDPLFPPEEDQGLDEVETILASFQWLDP